MSRWIIDPSSPDPQAERECFAYLNRRHQTRIPLLRLQELLTEAYVERAQEEFVMGEYGAARKSLECLESSNPFLDACGALCEIAARERGILTQQSVDASIEWDGWSPRTVVHDVYPTAGAMINAILAYRDELPNPEDYTLWSADDPRRRLIGFATEDRRWRIGLHSFRFLPEDSPYVEYLISAEARREFAERLWNET